MVCGRAEGLLPAHTPRLTGDNARNAQRQTRVRVVPAGGLEETYAKANKIKQFFARLDLHGVGGLVAQGYVIVSYFSNLSLLTMLEIDCQRMAGVPVLCVCVSP